MGSFLNVCIYRMPLSKSIILGSHCPNCKRSIHWRQNIPLASFIFLKGKCGHCNVQISLQYPMVELLTGLITFAVVKNFGISFNVIFYLIFIYTLIVISVIDWKTKLILNKLVIFLGLAGLVYAAVTNQIDFLDAVYGSLAGGGALYLIAELAKFLYKKEALGLGDVKLAAALGFFLGWQYILFCLYCAFVFAGFYILIFKLKGGRISGAQIPMGPFFSLSAVMWLFYAKQIVDIYLIFF
jgi:leader peptidase (prepilin peptidase)/N-methyltransferase